MEQTTVGDETQQMIARKPLRNFVFYPAVQWPLITRNLMLVTFVSVGTGLAVVLVYLLRFGSSRFYFLSESSFVRMGSRSISEVVLPAVVAMEILALFVGWWLALLTSRKVALPIYKVLNWSQRICEGNLRYRLGARPGDRLAELSTAVNKVSQNFETTLVEIRDALRHEPLSPEARSRIESALSRYQLD